MRTPSVFVGSSSEGLEIARAIEFNLQNDAEVTLWNEAVFRLGYGALESLVIALGDFDFAIIVLTADDLITSREVTLLSPRDNVLFELGLFMGRLGRERTFIVYNPQELSKVPSDLAGVTAATYKSRSDSDLIAALGPPCHLIRLSIRRLGSFNLSPNLTIRTRDEVISLLGAAQQNIRDATTSLYVSGNDCKFIVESLSADLELAMLRGVRIKIICVDPESDAVNMLPLIDPRFDTPQKFKKSMESVHNELYNLRSAYPDAFEYKFLPILPAMGFFITDPDDPKGIIKVEMYTAKPWQPKQTRPHLIFPPEMGEWRQYFISQWENYWSLSRTPEGRQPCDRGIAFTEPFRRE